MSTKKFVLCLLHFVLLFSKGSFCEEQCNPLLVIVRQNALADSIDDCRVQSTKQNPATRYSCPTLQSALDLPCLNDPDCNVTIEIPPGKHLIDHAVQITASVNIIGSGSKNTILKCDHQFESNPSVNYTISFYSSMVKIYNVSMIDCSVPLSFDTVSSVYISSIEIRYNN